MADQISNQLNEHTDHTQAQNSQGSNLATQSEPNKHRSRGSFDDFSDELVKAISNDGSMISNIRHEEWTFTGFPDNRPLPTTDSHGRSFSISDADLDLASFPIQQAQFTTDGQSSHATQQHITHWLDRLPETYEYGAAGGDFSESTLRSGDSSEDSFIRSVSYDEVKVVLATRGRSLFKEQLDRNWELRRLSEVQEAAQRRSSSLSSWECDREPRWYKPRFDKIDWTVIDELKDFSFSTASRGRRLTRPDFPPMSPRAVACKLWPKRPDFSMLQGDVDIFHAHAPLKPSSDQMNGVQPSKGEDMETP
ncbi:MAG: hypothetical protein Q9170_003738 [Blastenia crenularia]